MRKTQFGNQCPVCLRNDVEGKDICSAIPWDEKTATLPVRNHSDNGVLVNCPDCGRYAVTDRDNVNLKSSRLRDWNPHCLSALLREQSIREKSTRPLPPFWLRFGMDPYGPFQQPPELMPIDLQELMRRWPRSVPERINRTLLNMAWLSRTAGQKVDFGPNDRTVAFAETDEVAQFHLASLVEREMLKIEQSIAGSIKAVSVTAKGWDFFEARTSGTPVRENPVFVAMWFGAESSSGDTHVKTKAEMSAVYAEGIEPAVRRAGYRVTRVDLEQYNDSVMDQVLGDIRVAPFVVADFTGHRNGVYLEAGFARGLGHPVIQTCAKSHFDNAHFDIKHLNHILWDDAKDLKEKLFQRIRGTIGQGPHPVP